MDWRKLIVGNEYTMENEHSKYKIRIMENKVTAIVFKLVREDGSLSHIDHTFTKKSWEGYKISPINDIQAESKIETREEKIMNLEKGGLYRLQGDKKSNWFEIEVVDILHNSYRIKVIDSGSGGNVGEEHTFAKDSAFFTSRKLEQFGGRVKLSKKDRAILKDLFVDLALATNDRNWFNQLGKGVLIDG